MTRQIKFTQSAIVTAREHGCDFLLSLDDDELLCPCEDGISIPKLLQPHLGSSKRCIHFANIEAVFPYAEKTDRPLSRPQTLFRAQHHVLYCNGKSAANLSQEVYCSGVHHFCMYDRTFA